MGKRKQILILASLHKKFWSSAATDHEEATKKWGEKEVKKNEKEGEVKKGKKKKKQTS